jgi:glycogen debranching enzyme
LLDLLKNQIDITRVPFSDRGSRLLVFQHHNKPSLYIKLAERLIHVEPGIESYLRRPPFMDELYFLDKDRQVLDFQVTTSPEVLQFETPIGIFQLAFQDSSTLVFGLPAHTTCGLKFRVNATHWHETETGGSIRLVRNIGYEVLNGEIVTNQPADNFPGVEILMHTNEDCSVSLQTWDGVRRRQQVKPFSVVADEARYRWAEWFGHAPVVDERYRAKYAYAWWVMGNNLVNPRGFLTRQAMVPSKSSYVGTWLWDSALHAIAYRHIDAELARDQVRVMLARQLPDGMLPDAIFDEGVVTEIGHPFPGRVTKPPIMAWAVLKIHEIHPDVNFLGEVYESLVRENKWWFKNNDDDRDGVVQYTHPYSSGLDDNPLWDHGMPAESPDINTHLQIQMMSLAKIAELIGKTDEALLWRQKADGLTQLMIQHLWDEDAGYFQALHDEKPIPVLTPFHLLPLWTGQLPDKLNKCLIDHLKNPDEFMGKYMLPTVAYRDPSYRSNKMWRGPVWANVNYFFVEALQKVGEVELAAQLRERTLEIIAGQPGISEYYDSSTGAAPKTAIPAFGWTSAVFIDLAIQASRETKRRNRSVEQ